MYFDRRVSCILSLCLALMASSTASADWTVYVAADLGISTGVANVSGEDTLTNPSVVFDDSARDSSPMISGAVGLSIPWNELMAWELPYELKLPDWPVRMELEFTGLREFEYVTFLVDATPPNPDDLFASSNKSWSIMTNFWFDLPLRSLYRPIRATFGRTPRRVRDILDPISFYAGVGVGTSHLDFESFSTIKTYARSNDWRFAWQVGTGFGYEVTKFVTLTTGYRYFKHDGFDMQLEDNVGTPRGSMVFKEDIHEFRASVRINVHSFKNPWLLLR